MRSFVLLAVLILLPTLANAQITEAMQIFENAVVVSRGGDHAKALEKFKQTLEIIEHDGSTDAFMAKVHYNCGVSLYHLRRLEESAAHLNAALRYSQRGYAKAHYVLGLIGLETNDLALAETSLRSAAALDSRNGEAWYELSRVYVALDEPAKAKKALAKAVRNGAVIRVHRDPTIMVRTTFIGDE